MTATMMWVGTSTQQKTGNMPQGYVGTTREEAEESCDGCVLRKGPCYYWMGAIRAHVSMMRAFGRGRDYSLTTALNASSRMARYVRGAVGGDPSIFSRSTVQGWADEVVAFGMKGLILYTHFPLGEGAHLRGLAMGSVDTLADADRALDAGWRVAVTLPVKLSSSKHNRIKDVPVWDGVEEFATPNGVPVTLCPAQLPWLRKDCNSCGLCNPQEHPLVKVIAFFMH
jgi:hypothetical protein